MKLPKDIIGENKLRDLIICMDYCNGKSPEEIKEERKLNITTRRIEQVIYVNKDFVNKHIGWDKSKRLWKLQRFIKDAKETKKDPVDVLEQIRKEIEGDKETILVKDRLVVIRYADKTEEVAGRLHMEQGDVPSDVVSLGNREKLVSHLAGDGIQRADS